MKNAITVWSIVGCSVLLVAALWSSPVLAQMLPNGRSSTVTGTGKLAIQQVNPIDSSAGTVQTPATSATPATKTAAPQEDGSTVSTPAGPRPSPGSDRVTTILVSAPANGMYFIAGEASMVTVAFYDDEKIPLLKSDLSTARLYVYGPQDQRYTTTSVKLLRANTDRSMQPHHYIDLLTNTDAVWSNNTVTYPLSAVTDELPGTYTATVWVVRDGDSLQQWMPLADFQIKTDVAETQIVGREKCAQCHLGAASALALEQAGLNGLNGQFYFHHVDGSSRNPNGNRARENWPVRTCKACHNQDGYAAHDGTPDPIVDRVHGIHNGVNLESAAGKDEFADYLDVVFPADIRNCPYCHVDDRWKTQPTQQACGACHDNIWFGDPSATPEGGENHPGGPQSNDNYCAACHPPDGDVLPPAVYPIQAVHLDEFLASLSTEHLVELSLSPPANGDYYEAGEAPTLTIVVKDAATKAVVDPNTITEVDWNRAELQVSGPRDDTMPVLTTAALDFSKSASTSYVANDLRVRTDPLDDDPGITRSATEITYQLADVAGLEPGTYTVFVWVREASSDLYGVQVINFQVGTDAVEAQIATNCTDCHDITNMHGSFPFKFAPDICKNCHDYQNQGIPSSGTWGTGSGNYGYGAQPISRRVHGVHFGHYLNKPEEIHGVDDAAEWAAIIFPQDVRNCVKCHATSDHWTEHPNRIACLGCHDADDAIAHGALMTVDPTPANPYSGDEVESCQVCHGEDGDFAPSVVHKIWDPYVPPYLRDMPPEDF